MESPPVSPPRRSPRWALLAAAAIWVLFALGTLPHVAPPLVASAVLGLLAWKLSPERAKSVALNVAVFAVLLGVADLALRAFAEGVLHYRAHERLLRPVPGFPSLSRYEPMVDLTLEERGDLGAMKGDPALGDPRKVRFTTDQLGFRNAPISSEPYDLLIIGDSFAVGMGTSQEDIFPTLLQRTHRTYALAMPGGPWEGYANLSLLRDAIPLKPGGTLVLLLFPGNDLDDHYYPLEIESSRGGSFVSRGLATFKGWRTRSFVGHVLRRVSRKGNRDAVLVQEHAGNKVLFYKPYDEARRRTVEQWKGHKNAAAFLSTLDAMRRLAEEKKLTLKLAVVPGKEEVYSWLLDPSASPGDGPSPFVRFLTPVAQERGLPVIDLGPDLIRQARELASKGTYVFWRDDTHLNGVGHGIVAQTLTRALSPK